MSGRGAYQPSYAWLTWAHSKHAIYDAMFGQAWSAYAAAQDALVLPEAPRAGLKRRAHLYFDFAAADLARHQLMDLRTVPDFVPSPQSYAPALRVLDNLRAHFVSIGLSPVEDVDSTRHWSPASSTSSGPTTPADAMEAPGRPGHGHVRRRRPPTEGAVMTTTDTAVAPRLNRSTAMRLAATEYACYLTQLRSLDADDWAQPTDCPAWDVRELAAHNLGIAEYAASPEEQQRQVRAAAARGGVFIDALTGLQVEERAGMTPDELVARYAEIGPAAGGPPARPSPRGRTRPRCRSRRL